MQLFALFHIQWRSGRSSQIAHRKGRELGLSEWKLDHLRHFGTGVQHRCRCHCGGRFAGVLCRYDSGWCCGSGIRPQWKGDWRLACLACRGACGCRSADRRRIGNANRLWHLRLLCGTFLHTLNERDEGNASRRGKQWACSSRPRSENRHRRKLLAAFLRLRLGGVYPTGRCAIASDGEGR
jgi:hypothetical protein